MLSYLHKRTRLFTKIIRDSKLIKKELASAQKLLSVDLHLEKHLQLEHQGRRTTINNPGEPKYLDRLRESGSQKDGTRTRGRNHDRVGMKKIPDQAEDRRETQEREGAVLQRS